MNMPLRPGDMTRLGPYELIGRLGEGGMGTVFLARGPDGRQVAIKMVRPEFAYESEFRGRFRSEVNRAKQVPPFSTAEVLDADPDHEPPYLVVEYVDGPSLAAEIREKGPFTDGALHSVAVGIATALTAIHGAGVIHRDLKPGNVLFARGGIKVIDFGIARAFEATSQHTRTDQMVGTVAYMAPERFDPVDGRPVTAAADIFAWGAVMAYAATGRTPFAADSAPATAMRILTQPPNLTGVPASLLEPIERALAKDPVERPTARELLDMLLSGGTGVPARAVPVDQAEETVRVAVPVAPPAPPAPPRRSRRRTALVVTAAAAILLAGGGLALSQMQEPRTDAGEAPLSSAPLPSAPSASVEDPVLPADRLAAVLRGNRQTLIHIAEIDRDLALDVNSAEVEPGDGTGAKSLFVLDPAGVDYQIRSLRDPVGEPELCLGVKISPDDWSQLVPTECGASEATLFSLQRTDGKDEKGRPTYQIYNETHGFVQWSTNEKVLYVQNVGDAPVLSTFSFVDRGPLPSPR